MSEQNQLKREGDGSIVDTWSSQQAPIAAPQPIPYPPALATLQQLRLRVSQRILVPREELNRTKQELEAQDSQHKQKLHDLRRGVATATTRKNEIRTQIAELQRELEIHEATIVQSSAELQILQQYIPAWDDAVAQGYEIAVELEAHTIESWHDRLTEDPCDTWQMEDVVELCNEIGLGILTPHITSTVQSGEQYTPKYFCFMTQAQWTNFKMQHNCTYGDIWYLKYALNHLKSGRGVPNPSVQYGPDDDPESWGRDQLAAFVSGIPGVTLAPKIRQARINGAVMYSMTEEQISTLSEGSENERQVLRYIVQVLKQKRSSRTYETSHYRRELNSHFPRSKGDVFRSVRTLVYAFGAHNNVPQDNVDKFAQHLIRECEEKVDKAALSQDDFLRAIVECLWTSLLTMEYANKEFSGILNTFLREDWARPSPYVATLCRAMSFLYVSHVKDEIPPKVVYRGTSLPDPGFFQPNCKFRVPSFFSTTSKFCVAKMFRNRSLSFFPQNIGVYFVVELDPNQQCRQVHLVRYSQFQGEFEYLFSPYSVFTVLRVQFHQTIRHVDIFLQPAYDMNNEAHDLPLGWM
eukprot:c20457_g1_i1.p1 GENE.c20457_g1_i1~~c20457_g1_i1.p1  ORF type:complete len:588 (+),score=101.70 c20457_g1_i1:31-1764(+)